MPQQVIDGYCVWHCLRTSSSRQVGKQESGNQKGKGGHECIPSCDLWLQQQGLEWSKSRADSNIFKPSSGRRIRLDIRWPFLEFEQIGRKYCMANPDDNSVGRRTVFWTQRTARYQTGHQHICIWVSWPLSELAGSWMAVCRLYLGQSTFWSAEHRSFKPATQSISTGRGCW